MFKKAIRYRKVEKVSIRVEDEHRKRCRRKDCRFRLSRISMKIFKVLQEIGFCPGTTIFPCNVFPRRGSKSSTFLGRTSVSSVSCAAKQRFFRIHEAIEIPLFTYRKTRQEIRRTQIGFINIYFLRRRGETRSKLGVYVCSLSGIAPSREAWQNPCRT